MVYLLLNLNHHYCPFLQLLPSTFTLWVAFLRIYTHTQTYCVYTCECEYVMGERCGGGRERRRWTGGERGLEREIRASHAKLK